MQIISATPPIVRMQYRQEKGDPDYGTCLWADFDLDTVKYSLQIMSDCGNYSYRWHPTPDSESFFDLCRRFDKYYLIDKLADRVQIDDETIIKNALDFFNRRYSDVLGHPKGKWKKELEDELSNSCNEIEIVNRLESFCENHDIAVDPYDLCDLIEKDYTAGAKKIVQVFMDYIVPVLPREYHP